MRDKRKHSRAASRTLIRYRRLAPDKSPMEYREGLVENVGMGGVFISTEEPLPQGSLVELEFSVSVQGRKKTIGAKALVKWNRKMFPPTGMGLEFVEFSGLGGTEFSEWIACLVDPAQI